MANTNENSNLNAQANRTSAVLLLALGQTVVWAALFYVFPAMILQWEQAHGWSVTQITGAITVALLMSAIASPWIGRLIDRGRGPLAMSLGAAFGAVLQLSLIFACELWQFYTIWALTGIALAACLYEPCFMLVTRAYGKSAKRSIITITLIAGFAGTISFPASHLIGTEFGWRSVSIVFGAAVLLLGVPLLYTGASILEKHVLPDRSTAPATGQLKLLKNPSVVLLGLSFALLALVHGATLHHLLPVLNQRGLTEGSAVLVASFIGPMQVAGRLVMTIFQRKLTHSIIAHSCFLFIGVSMCLLFFSGRGFAVAVLFACVFGASYGIVSIIRPVIARDVLGDSGFGAKSGLLAFFYLIGSAVSPYLGSLMWKLGGYDLMIPVLGGISALGLVTLRRVIKASF